MRLTINLATRRYINMRRLNAALLASFLLLAALLVYKVREIADNQAQLNQIRHQSAAADSGPAGGPAVNPAEVKAQAARIALVNSLIDKKAVNWVGILDKLEQVVPGGVALTQVTPALRDQTLKISGVARSFDTLRTLLENMEQSPSFTEVLLLGQSELKVGLTQQGVGFSLSCKVDFR
ncbi:MAG TPA: fimbrial protein [Geobacter sp.]|nr:fimbrial protein [Geobacter sp.]